MQPATRRTAVRSALVVASTLMLLGQPRVAGGQELSTLAPGTRLRVNHRCAKCVRRTGDFIGVTGDTLWLAAGRSRDVFVLTGDIVTLEMLRTRDRARGAKRGALAGFLIGVALTAIAVVGDWDNSPDAPTPEARALIGTIVLGGSGAIIGALVGRARGAREWVPVAVRR